MKPSKQQIAKYCKDLYSVGISCLTPSDEISSKIVVKTAMILHDPKIVESSLCKACRIHNFDNVNEIPGEAFSTLLSNVVRGMLVVDGVRWAMPFRAA